MSPVLFGILPLAHLALWAACLGTPEGDAARPDSDAASAITKSAPTHETAPAECGYLRPGDRVWLISSRHVSCGIAPAEAVAALSFHRYEHNGWREASLDEFLASHDPAIRLRFHIHGARVSADETIRRCWTVYEHLVRATGDPEPVQLVTWSWPTSKAGRPVRDLREMTARSDWEALYVGALLARLAPESRLELLGYSLGCRVISGSLQILAGGEWLGQTIVTPVPSNAGRRSIRVVMWAPAMPNHWLWPGQPMERTLPLVDEILIVYNTCDRALRRYRLADPCGDPEALGHTGLGFVSGMEAVRDRVRQFDARELLGGQHSFYNHVCSPYIVEATSALFAAGP